MEMDNLSSEERCVVEDQVLTIDRFRNSNFTKTFLRHTLSRLWTSQVICAVQFGLCQVSEKENVFSGSRYSSYPLKYLKLLNYQDFLPSYKLLSWHLYSVVEGLDFLPLCQEASSMTLKTSGHRQNGRWTLILVPPPSSALSSSVFI